ncbi:MAG: sigma 54-interacting transcriptional regulator [Fibrobacteres bacterium]|nr:sigma 54-interacting transcriptional regulator [Fibrobacterota bacterium]
MLRHSGISDFYTDLPTCSLKLYSTASDNYLGIITDTEIIPNIHSALANHIIYVDANNRLRGFNDSFRNLWPDHSIESMLGKNVEDFLKPSPLVFQKSMLNEILLKPTHWRLQREYNNPKKADFILHDTCIITHSTDAITCENRENDNQFITLRQQLDIDHFDYRLIVDCEMIKGGYPVLVFGEKEPFNEKPSYLAGEDGKRDGFVLKKRGYILSRVPYKEISGRKVFSLEVRSQAFILEMDGQKLIQYFDIECPKFVSAHFSLSIRSANVIKIYRLKIESSPKKSLLNVDSIIRLNKPEDSRHLAFSHIENIGLTMRFKDITAYMLTDVTAMQEKVHQYRSRYNEEKARSTILAGRLGEDRDAEDDFVGESRLIAEIKDKGRIMAASEATILIQGETGTGKEVLAKFLHKKSHKSSGQFVKIDCSAIPSSLIESELFGYEKGAFTGAVRGRKGRLELANHGTLFLDELSNIGLDIQAKLLQFLQDRKIVRIGGDKPIQLDVRIIAASNTRLNVLVKNGLIREDLYYRLNMMTLDLPPLRERTEDIPLLSLKIIRDLNRIHYKEISGLAPDAITQLCRYSWPGNIRELENVLRHAHLFCETDVIESRHIVLNQQNDNHLTSTNKKVSYHLKEMTKERLKELFRKHRGIVAAVARDLNITRKACYENVRKFEIDITSFRPSK